MGCDNIYCVEMRAVLKAHLGIAVRGQVKLLWKGNWAVDSAQAAAEVLLEALQVQRQHLRGPAHAHQPFKPADWRESCSPKRPARSPSGKAQQVSKAASTPKRSMAVKMLPRFWCGQQGLLALAGDVKAGSKASDL